jgi:hypothetical protein
MFKRMGSRGPDGQRDGRLEDGTPPTDVDLNDHAEMVLNMKMVILFRYPGVWRLGTAGTTGELHMLFGAPYLRVHWPVRAETNASRSFVGHGVIRFNQSKFQVHHRTTSFPQTCKPHIMQAVAQKP